MNATAMSSFMTLRVVPFDARVLLTIFIATIVTLGVFVRQVLPRSLAIIASFGNSSGIRVSIGALGLFSMDDVVLTFTRGRAREVKIKRMAYVGKTSTLATWLFNFASNERRDDTCATIYRVDSDRVVEVENYPHSPT